MEIGFKLLLTKPNSNRACNIGLRMLSFPCNQFASEMPEDDGEQMVCHLRSANADVGDVFQKVDVNGENADPLWQYLKHKQTGILGGAIKWYFTKIPGGPERTASGSFCTDH